VGRFTLDILVGEEQGVTVVSVDGAVDSATIGEFEKKVGPLCSRPGAMVLLDCSKLTYLNSRGIGYLTKYHRGLIVSRGKLFLCGLNNKLVRTFELLQLGKALKTFPTREEALAAFG